jgi:acetylornithine deacetylase
MDTRQMDARKERIAATTESLRPALVDALAALVRVSSQTGDEGKAQEVAARLMREHGLAVDVWEPDAVELAPHAHYVTVGDGFADRPNVVGVARGQGGGQSLILNGHIDTVEIGDRAAWNRDPLGAEIVDDRLYGRGSCDMKGGIVANLFALAVLRQAGIQLRGDVIIESTVAEEDGGAGALAAILRGYRADGALIPEPTNLAIVPAQGGTLMFRLHVPGLSAHACVRDEGVSAIEKFSYLHRGLLDFETRHNAAIAHPLYADMRNKAPINIGMVRGGAWPSSVPESVAAEGRVGLVPGEDPEQLRGAFINVVATLAAADPWLRDHPPRVEWLPGQIFPAEVAADSPLVRTLAAAYETVTASTPRIEAVTYGADMRHFINAGIPCVMFGAGDVRAAHAPNESIPLGDLASAVAVSALFIASWCGVA